MRRKVTMSLAVLALGIPASLATQRGATSQTADEPRSSYNLIDEALTASRIDAETAYRYRVFAAFGDSRLPASYRGTVVPADPPSQVWSVGEVLGTLSPQTQSELAPFFMRPDEPGSWITLGTLNNQGPSGGPPSGDGASILPLHTAAFAGRAFSATSRTAVRNSAALRRQVSPAPSVPGGWKTFPAAHGRAMVWAQVRDTGAVRKAKGLASELSSVIWDKLVNYMGVEPAADSNIAKNGGGNELDFYLVHAPIVTNKSGTRGPAWLGVTMPAISFLPCAPQRYILLDSRQPLGSATTPGLLSVAAHELMHAITLMFRVADNNGCGDPWIVEASGAWAENFVYPLANAEHPWAKEFLNLPHYPIDDLTGTRYYGAYLLPLFVERVNDANFMRRIWRQFKTEKSLQGVNSVLTDGWDKQWPEFLVRNWNRPPIDGKSYRAWDALRTPVSENAVTIDTKNGPVTEQMPMPVRFDPATQSTSGLDYLSGFYYHFKFQSSVHTISLDNTFAEYKKINPHISLWAIAKTAGVWAQPEDWTDKPSKDWCRDKPSEDLEELVIVLGNSDWQTKKRFSPETPPSLTAYPQGCASWIGTYTDTATYEGPDKSTIVETVDVTNLTFMADSDYILPGQPVGHWKVVAGALTWAATVSGACSGGGSGSLAIKDEGGGAEIARIQIQNEGQEIVVTNSTGPWPGNTPTFSVKCPNGTINPPLQLANSWFDLDRTNDRFPGNIRTLTAHYTENLGGILRLVRSYTLRLTP